MQETTFPNCYKLQIACMRKPRTVSERTAGRSQQVTSVSSAAEAWWTAKRVKGRSRSLLQDFITAFVCMHWDTKTISLDSTCFDLNLRQRLSKYEAEVINNNIRPIHACTHIHAYMCVYMYRYTVTHTCMHIHAYIDTYVHTHTDSRIRTYIRGRFQK
jgi:hypothetical protein